MALHRLGSPTCRSTPSCPHRAPARPSSAATGGRSSIERCAPASSSSVPRLRPRGHPRARRRPDRPGHHRRDDLSVTVDLGDDVFPERAERGLIGAPAHGLWAMWTEGATRRLALRGFDRPARHPPLRGLDHVPLHVPAADAERFRRLFLPRLGAPSGSVPATATSTRCAMPPRCSSSTSAPMPPTASTSTSPRLRPRWRRPGPARRSRCRHPARRSCRAQALAAPRPARRPPGSRQRGMQNEHWWLARSTTACRRSESRASALDVLPDPRPIRRCGSSSTVSSRHTRR